MEEIGGPGGRLSRSRLARFRELVDQLAARDAGGWSGVGTGSRTSVGFAGCGAFGCGRWEECRAGKSPSPMATGGNGRLVVRVGGIRYAAWSPPRSAPCLP